MVPARPRYTGTRLKSAERCLVDLVANLLLGVGLMAALAVLVFVLNRRGPQQDPARQAAENRASRLQAIISTAVDAIVMSDDRGIIEEVNPAAEAMFGYRAEEMIGKNVSLLMPEPYHDAHDGYLQAYLTSGQAKIIGIGREVVALRKSGSTFPAHLSVSEVTVAGRRYFTGILHDRTERTKAEAVKTRLGRIIEDSVNEVFVFDADSLRFLMVNRGARENLGFSAEDLGAMTPVDIKPDHDAASFEALLAPLRAGERDLVEFETRHKRKDGSHYEVAVRLQLMPAETPPVFVAIIEDVTERKHHEAQLRHAQRMDVVGQLTGGVAHDFNNLLTVITGNLEMLEPRLTDDKQREFVEQAQEAAELGATLTARLLAFARRQTLEPRTIDLNDLVLGMAELLRRTLGEAIQINTVLGNRLWQTRADPGQVENALLNLCLNARDAMPQGGSLTIETSNEVLDADTLEQGLEVAAGPFALLSVSDNGTGMPPEIRDRVFEPFFTTKETGTGTGLGLSMVYGFAKQSGGHTAIYSEFGQGTTVNLYLPALEEPEAAEDTGSAQTEPAGGEELILVVEDDERVRRISVARLTDLGYRVLEADSGQAGLALLARHPEIGLLFTDVVMPGGMNGPDLAREARRSRPDLPVLFTTGYAEAGAQEAGLLDDGALMLRKPYRTADLAGKLREALRRGTPRS